MKLRLPERQMKRGFTLNAVLPEGPPPNSRRARLRFFMASTWWCMFGGELGPFATKGEIRRKTRTWVSEYWRKEESARFERRLAEARQRFGVRDEATGVVTLPLTPEVEEFLLGAAEAEG